MRKIDKKAQDFLNELRRLKETNRDSTRHVVDSNFEDRAIEIIEGLLHDRDRPTADLFQRF